MTSPQITGSISERQQRLINDFLLFDEWGERYQYLIDLGKQLPEMPASLRTDSNRVPQCRGDTFLAGKREGAGLVLHAASDTPILAGILYLIVELYSGLPPAEIIRNPPVLLDKIGLTQNLSMHRRVALLRIHERLIALAADIEAPRRLVS